MPHFTHDNILVVTYEELVPEFYKTINSLSATVSRDERRGYGMKRYQAGCFAREALIIYDTLPERMKAGIADPRKTEHVLERFFAIDDETVSFYQTYEFWDGSGLDDEPIEQYVANASVLKAVFALMEARIAEIRRMNKVPKKIWQTLCYDATSFRPVMEKKYGISHNLPENYRRFQERALRFNTADGEYAYSYASLISGRHLNKNSAKVDEGVVQLLEQMFAYIQYKPNYTEVADTYSAFLAGEVEVINNATGELYNPKEFPQLSKSTVQRYLSEWKSRIATHTIRSGDRQKLMGKYKPYHSMDKPQFSGSLLSIDDRQAPFEYAPGQRLWLYMGIDVHSECYTVWTYGKSKESMIIEFYRQLVRNYSEWGLCMPAELEAESSLNSSFKDSFLREGSMFQYVRIEANNARGKIIERFNGIKRNQRERKQEGWIARPFARAEYLQASSAKSKLVPYDDIVYMVLKDIEDWNNEPHSIYKDKTRFEVFLERQHPELKPINYRSILPSLGYKTSTSCNNGIVKLQGREWLIGGDDAVMMGDALISAMNRIEGEALDVYWLDDNDGNVLKAFAYLRDGTKMMCQLVPKPRYNRARIEQTSEDISNREIMSKYVATIEAYNRSKRKSLDKVSVLDNRVHTLNNKFRIRGLGSAMTEHEVEELPSVSEIEDMEGFGEDNAPDVFQMMRDKF
jgi:hypothetical protein